MSELIGGAGGIGWVAAKAVLLFAVAVRGTRWLSSAGRVVSGP
jgi:hypothetical protein